MCSVSSIAKPCHFSTDRYRMVQNFPMNSSQEQRLLNEISTARALFDHFGHVLCQQPKILRLLSLYRNAIKETQSAMHQLGITTGCTVCAEQGRGSCCFEGIEIGYDHLLLLINLLMGCPLPDSREVPESCFFVGITGCKLWARYYYCVHYLCPAVQTTLRSSAKELLMSTVGKELAAGWELEQALQEWRRKSSASAQFMLE
jgi:hypothetical protein